MTCSKCNVDTDPVLTAAGPHIKASCGDCGAYIKFISKNDNLYPKAEEVKFVRPTLESIKKLI